MEYKRHPDGLKTYLKTLIKNSGKRFEHIGKFCNLVYENNTASSIQEIPLKYFIQAGMSRVSINWIISILNRISSNYIYKGASLRPGEEFTIEIVLNSASPFNYAKKQDPDKYPLVIGLSSRVISSVLNALEEIGDQKDENRLKKHSGYIYWISFTKNREILINDKYLLAKPNFQSENAEFFEYIFKNSGRQISIDEIKKNSGTGSLKKSINSILSNLSFSGEIRKTFFPGASKTKVIFRKKVNDISLEKKQAIERQLSLLRTNRNK